MVTRIVHRSLPIKRQVAPGSSASLGAKCSPQIVCLLPTYFVPGRSLHSQYSCRLIMMVRGLIIVACLACLATNSVGFVVGPTTTAFRVANSANVAASRYSTSRVSEPSGFFVRGVGLAAESHLQVGSLSRASVMRETASQITMMSIGAGKKTAIITGASSGKLVASLL